ncbi:MAG: Holliday junction ATP-dependent DNA helicase RuvA [Rhodoluna sp.]|nr:Holliday junction ATP-dependent DNA helicase RuvA [Rhodoluna sp.]
MIASLRGTVSRTFLGGLVLDVAGVGYLVSVSPALSAGFASGDEAHLHTSYIVREDAHTIYGFATVEELEMFDLLRSVTGVGPKSALGIVSAVGVDEIRNAVAGEQDSVFRAVSGIGPKTAKLITVTLAGKLVGSSNSTDSELLSALMGLGYKEAAASAALREASGTDQQSKLRSALSILAGGKK